MPSGDLPRHFDPIPEIATAPDDWGHHATHFMRPQTPWAQRFATAIERASDGRQLANYVAHETDANDVYPAIRRWVELTRDTAWLNDNEPTGIHPADRAIIDTGNAKIRKATEELNAAAITAMLAFNTELQNSARDHRGTTQHREQLTALRQDWSETLDALTSGAPPDTAEHELVTAMRETVTLLDQAIG